MTAATPAAFPRRLPWRDVWIIGIALGCLLLHGRMIARALSSPQDDGQPPAWSMPDTDSYLANAQMLREGRPLSPVFRERLLLPALIACVEQAGLPPQQVLWFPWLLHVPALLAAAWLAGHLSPSRWAPRVAALLYALWPAVFASGTQVGTDMLHAQAVLVAAALTVRWSTARGGSPWPPLAAWWVVQLIRPSFYPAVGALLPFLVPPLRRPGAGRRSALAFAAGLVAVPLAFTVLNALQYGIAAPSLAGVESLHRNVVARIRALQRNAATPGPMTTYFLEEREQIAKQDADWQAVAIYQAGGGQRDFATHYRNLQAKGKAFVASNRAWFVRSSLMEVENQLRRVHAVPGVASVAGGTAAGDAGLLRLQKAGLLLALLGWAVSLRRRPAYALFLALCCGMILAACSMLWWESSRIRMPLEALAFPCIALALGSRRAWVALGAIVLVGWLPIRLFGCPETWLLLVVGLAAAALALRTPPPAGSPEGTPP